MAVALEPAEGLVLDHAVGIGVVFFVAQGVFFVKELAVIVVFVAFAVDFGRAPVFVLLDEAGDFYIPGYSVGADGFF